MRTLWQSIIFAGLFLCLFSVEAYAATKNLRNVRQELSFPNDGNELRAARITKHKSSNQAFVYSVQVKRNNKTYYLADNYTEREMLCQGLGFAGTNHEFAPVTLLKSARQTVGTSRDGETLQKLRGQDSVVVIDMVSCQIQ